LTPDAGVAFAVANPDDVGRQLLIFGAPDVLDLASKGALGGLAAATWGEPNKILQSLWQLLGVDRRLVAALCVAFAPSGSQGRKQRTNRHR
jgi:hypothetical protein